jgi:hypothetical protein
MSAFYWFEKDSLVRRELYYANNQIGIAGGWQATVDFCVSFGKWEVRANKLSGPVYVASEEEAERTAMELATSALIVDATVQALESEKLIDTTVSSEDAADARRRCISGLRVYTSDVLRALVAFAESIGNKGRRDRQQVTDRCPARS